MNLHLTPTLPARASPLMLGAADAVLVLCAVTLGSVTGILPFFGSQATPRHEPVVLSVAPGPVAASQCPSCGTVLMIRTYELSDGSDASQDGGKKRFVYRVTVRMEDGSFRTLSQGAEPGFRPGDKVRLAQGALVSN